MTGWRMGYGVMRADLATHVARLMTNSNSCTASFTQVAGIEALRATGLSRGMCAEFKKRRDVMVAGLNEIKGFPVACPRAPLRFPERQARPGGHRRNWPTRCLMMPASPRSGTAFGDFGEGYLRFSVANSIENIEKALDRVGAWATKNL